MGYYKKIMSQAVVIVGLFVAIGCEDYKLDHKENAYLNTKTGHPSGGNTVKLFDIAADTTNNKLYVHSILSSHIAKIDSETGELEEYIDSELTGYHLSYMAVRNSTGNLFIVDEKSAKLIKIDTDKGEKTKDEFDFDTQMPNQKAKDCDGVYKTSSAFPSRVAVYDNEGLVVVSLASHNKVVFIDANSMEKVREFTRSDGMYGPKDLKVKGGKIYIALSRGQGANYCDEDFSDTKSGVAVIDPSDWSVNVHTTKYKGASEIAVDVSGERFWLQSDHRIWFFDTKGNSKSISDGDNEFKEVRYSKNLDKVILLTRDGADSEEDAASYGSIELLDPESLDSTQSIQVGMKPSRMAVDLGLKKVFTANMAEGKVSVVELEQYEEDDSSTGLEVTIDKENSIFNTISTNAKRLIQKVARFFSSSASSSSSSSSIENIIESVPTYQKVSERTYDKVSSIFDSNVIGKIDKTPGLINLLKKKADQTIDIGTSLEDVLVHPDGGQAYIVNRLGGSEVFLYDKSSDSIIETIKVSNWPVKMAVDSGRRELYVLSHYASTIDIIDIDSNEVTGQIDMTTHSDIEQNRTHFLSDMVYNKGNNRIYCSFPEQGIIVEASVTSKSVRYVKTDGFDPITDEHDEDDSSTQVGRVQLAVDGTSSKVYAYYRDDYKLVVMDPSKNLEEIQEVTDGLSKDTFDGNGYQASLLTIDVNGRRLFLGPRVYGISGGQLSYDREISNIDKVIGLTDDYVVGVSANVTSGEVEVFAFEIKNSGRFKKVMSEEIEDMKVLPPKIAIDEKNEVLYAGYLERAKLKVYKLEEK